MRILVQPEERTVRVVVSGDVDIATCPRLKERLDVVAGRGLLVLDLARVTFLDSSAIALLVGLQRRSEREGWQWRLIPPAGPALRCLDAAGVLPRLGTHATPVVS